MKTVSRALTAAAAGVALFGLSACSGGGAGDTTTGEPTTEPQAKAIESFDPCTFFESDELTSFGVSTQSQDFSPVSFEPGCKWDGEKLDISLQKNAEETVDSYESSGSWDSYHKTTIAGRQGAVALETGATDVGSCTVLVDAGGGVAIYMLDGMMRDSVADPCGELEKIANQTASRLPK
ncbi:hypothetical protein GCM10009854_05120 [Saccharopolyspora halophila]|uniref:DUF3558 domain-containing protein n=1 Tax=Saccharopolyspora halophila TaxID=405551 RepID=A0ABN3FM46_9PSEU